MTSPTPGGAVELGVAYISLLPETRGFANAARDGIRDAQRTADQNPIDLRAQIDVSNVQREIDRVRGRTITQRVNLDIDRSGLSKLAGGTAAVSAGLAGIGGAAGVAVGAVGALAAGLAALGPAAAAGLATAAVGVQGIGDAFKALSAAEDAAGRDGAAQAKAVAAAQEQVQTALEGVADAQRNLADAQKDSEDATKDIAQAYKDARDELEDYQFQLADAALSEKEAALAVREAEKAVREAKPEDREKALLRLERANLRYAEAQEANRDVQEEAAEAEAKGVEGSDKVVAAKERAQSANERVADAERQLARAHDQVAKAQQAVTDAATKGSAAQDKAAQAMAELAPNAQAFVLAARELKPLWDDLVGDPTQDALFANSAQGIRDLAEAALPALGRGMVDVASSMNGLTHQFAAFWAAPENLAGLEAIFAGTANFIDGLGPGLQQATQGFLSMGAAAEPVMNKVGAQVGGMLGQIGQAFTDAADSGALTQLISGFGDVIQGLGEGLNPLIDGLIQAGNIIVPVLGPFLTQLGETIGAVAPSLAQLGATFLTALQPVLPVLGNLISAFATGLQPVLPVLSTLLQSVGNALIPLIEPMSQIAQVVGTALTEAIDALAPAIGPIGEAFASLVTAVAPLIPTIATVVSGLVQALAPALTTIFDALGPVIKQWTDLMIPVFEQIQPILAEVAGVIGTAIADALNQIAPLLPDIAQSFSGLLLAVAPLLPELVKLGAELLPPLIGLLVEMTPVTLKIVDALTWLVDNLVQYVIPQIQSLTDTVSTAVDGITDAFRDGKTILSGVIDDIGGYFTGLGSTVTAAWDVIVGAIKVSVGKIGRFLRDLPEIKIPDIPGVPGRGTTIGFQGIGRSMVAWSEQGMKDGGLFRGIGTKTSDSNLVALSDEEFVVNADATAKTLPILEAINAGWVPPADFLHAMVPGFKDGGMVAGKKFATSMDSADYLMGGFSRSAIDCSAMVSAVVNDALGLDPFDSRMSTVNEGQWLAAKGALPGLGGPGDISVGWFDNGGGANGHTALTLGDGTNVESRSGDGVVIGSSAAGADDPMFDQHMHIPEKLLRGGDPGAGVTGRGLGPDMSGGGKSRSGGTSGGGMKKSRQSAGGGPGGTSSGPSQDEGAAPSDFGGVTDVFVTNWPPELGSGITTGGPAGGGIPLTYSDPAAPATTYGTDTQTYTAPTSTPAVTPPAPDSSTHPLAHIPLPGAAAGLFQGPAPWYMAATPEQALANLGSQAAGMAQRTVSDVQGFFQDNWQEMLETGAGVLGMGAGMGGGTVNNYNISGTDPMSAAAAVDRVVRRRSLATQRSGGFGR